MMENEVGSIINFILNSVGNITLYYNNVPEGFAVPSVFFSSPETVFLPDTLDSYGTEYVMYVNFFHKSTEEAYALALPVFHRINAVHRKIPMLDKSGKKVGEFVRIKDLRLKKADECAYELALEWVSRRPYDKSDTVTVKRFFMNGGVL